MTLEEPEEHFLSNLVFIFILIKSSHCLNLLPASLCVVQVVQLAFMIEFNTDFLCVQTLQERVCEFQARLRNEDAAKQLLLQRLQTHDDHHYEEHSSFNQEPQEQLRLNGVQLNQAVSPTGEKHIMYWSHFISGVFNYVLASKNIVRYSVLIIVFMLLLLR